MHIIDFINFFNFTEGVEPLPYDLYCRSTTHPFLGGGLSVWIYRKIIQ